MCWAFLFDAPFGIPDVLNGLRRRGQNCYLGEHNGRQFLVTVPDEFVESRQLAKQVTGDKFEIGSMCCHRCACQVK